MKPFPTLLYSTALFKRAELINCITTYDKHVTTVGHEETKLLKKKTPMSIHFS